MPSKSVRKHRITHDRHLWICDRGPRLGVHHKVVPPGAVGMKLGTRHPICIALAASVFATAPRSANAQRTSPAADSVQRVVQSFYDWYVPFAQRYHGRAWMPALNYGRIRFSRELTRALRQDSVAQARAGNEIDGLDGDPFLNAQDPCDRYTVRSAKQKTSMWLLEIVGSGGCARHSKPDVIAEVSAGHDTLTFVNFIYPDSTGGDLLSLLRLLHPARRAR